MKLFIVVLVLLALLFALGMAWGLRGRDQEASESWTATLQDLFPGPARLRPQTVSAACRRGSQFVVGPGATCVAQVRGDRAPVRRARLRLVKGLRATAEWRPAGEAATFPGRLVLAPGATKDVTIQDSGGALLLVCVSAGSGDCAIALE